MSSIAAIGSRPFTLGHGTPVPPYVNSVSVAPDPFTVDTGDTIQLTAQSLDQHSNPIADTHTWVSSDDALATVNGSGLVTGVSAGVVFITATSVTNPAKSGFADGTVTGAFGPNDFQLEVAPSGNDFALQPSPF